MYTTFTPPFGELTVRQVYWEVNEPTLFSATNELGDIFIVSYADMTDDGDAWIVARTNLILLRDFENGITDIRDLFLKSPLKTILYIEFSNSEKSPVIRHLTPDDVELKEYLPDIGRKIPYPVETAMPSDVASSHRNMPSVVKFINQEKGVFYFSEAQKSSSSNIDFPKLVVKKPQASQISRGSIELGPVRLFKA